MIPIKHITVDTANTAVAVMALHYPPITHSFVPITHNPGIAKDRLLVPLGVFASK